MIHQNKKYIINNKTPHHHPTQLYSHHYILNVSTARKFSFHVNDRFLITTYALWRSGMYPASTTKMLFWRPERSLLGRPEISLLWRPERSLLGRPEISLLGRPERSLLGRPERLFLGRPRECNRYYCYDYESLWKFLSTKTTRFRVNLIVKIGPQSFLPRGTNFNIEYRIMNLD